MFNPRNISMVGLALLGLAAFALPTTADWNPGDPYKMHYPQLPDLTNTGIDVLATVQGDWASQPQWKILADDWLCTETGPVSDIHIWGSWRNSHLPNGDPNNVVFKLSIHDDVPAGPTTFSRPGLLLWQGFYRPGQFTVLPNIVSGVTWRFFDPNLVQNPIVGQDSTAWQYNFTNLGVNGVPLFEQRQGHIYWLDVQAQPLDPTAFFGWKTTNPLDPRTPHFQDDAVFADTAAFGGALITPWAPLVYPPGAFEGQSIDLAFVITPEPGTIAMLLGVGVAGLVALVRRRRR
jgi:hypothetical protein